PDPSRSSAPTADSPAPPASRHASPTRLWPTPSPLLLPARLFTIWSAVRIPAARAPTATAASPPIRAILSTRGRPPVPESLHSPRTGRPADDGGVGVPGHHLHIRASAGVHTLRQPVRDGSRAGGAADHLLAPDPGREGPTNRGPGPGLTRVNLHLIDGTYELFRHFFAVPSARDANGQEIGAVRGVLSSVASMIEQGATHLGVATDHAIESFRNDLYPGYKTSEGVPPELLSQFPVLEEGLEAMGVVVWPMVEFEADDALASAAGKAARDERVEQVIICTPDKDLSQCVAGTRVVQLDRRRGI